MTLSNKQQCINHMRADRKFMATAKRVYELFKADTGDNYPEYESLVEDVHNRMSRWEHKYNVTTSITVMDLLEE